ncbi:protein bicaudal C homolog 1-like [Brachyistius frenatus]|uniref:protein bicaudal C homolog 1-like n=1 Tax=Brachyistius frenatus TaxID=100188 RepID=UPI0037E8C324
MEESRVTLKMNVCHKAHCHIIGDGGGNVQRVEEETGCYVHLPDFNLKKNRTKKNHVIIKGPLERVEAARVQVMALVPFVLSFKLPDVLQASPTSPTVRSICQTFNLRVSFQPPTRRYGASCVVYSSQNNADRVRTGAALLMEQLAGGLASTISVSTYLDIAPNVHRFVKGQNNSNVKDIGHKTGAQVHFPESDSAHRNHTVYIQGSLEAVWTARRHLLGCLPLSLRFYLREDVEVDPQCLTALMEQLDVLISTKPKEPGRTVTVKSVERNALRMYQARTFLLGLESSGSSCCDDLNPTAHGPSPSWSPSRSPTLSPSRSPTQSLTPSPIPPLSSQDVPSRAGPGHLDLLGATAPHSLPKSDASMNPPPTPDPCTPTLPPGELPCPAPSDRRFCGATDCAPLGHVHHPGSVSGSLDPSGLSPAPCDSVQQVTGGNPTELVPIKSSPESQRSMPRSPSDPELKQKTSSGTPQTVVLLPGTKNSHLHPDLLLPGPASGPADGPERNKRGPVSKQNKEEREQTVESSKRGSQNPSLKDSELPQLLSKPGLGKYTDVLQQNHVDL